MSDWTAGYVADLGYTFGYYPELNPLRVPLAFTDAGLAAPAGLIGVGEATACELGFGQGLSVNIHAAASNVSWWGTDFNPSQAGFAHSLAAASGAGASLFDEAFAEFCSRSDLPEFDFICMHGIWSWISDENRSILVDFIRRKLKVGGVLYISYNTLPGWATFSPIRHLMTEHAKILGAEGSGVVRRIEGAIDFIEKLLALNPVYLRANPQVADRLAKVKENNLNYLAHEYFNRDWCPMHFATIAKCLKSAKLEFACSANYLDTVDAINLTGDQRRFLNEIPDPTLRQTARDFMVNQQFRKDYWVKGARRLNPLEKKTALRTKRVIMTTFREDVSLTVTGSLGAAKLSEAVYQPVLDRMSDYQPHSLGELEASLTKHNINFAQMKEAVTVLCGAGYLYPVQEHSSGTSLASKCAKNAKALNDHLIDKAHGSAEIGYLASTTTGGGVPVNRIQQLFLHAISLGKKMPQDWAGHTWSILSDQGQHLIKDGKEIRSVEENLAEIEKQAISFAEKRLPILKTVGIA